MKALTVDFELITQSMRDLSREHHDYFLEKSTGKVISLSRNLIRSLTHEGFEGQEEVPKWDAQLIPLARKIVLAGSKDFIRIPESFGKPEHHWRVAFTETIRSKELKHKLTLALKGRGSVRRFKEILKENSEESQRWRTCHSDQWKAHVRHWLESLSILAFDQRPRRVSSVK